MGEVKAARERLARKVWRNMREYRDVHTLLDDHARLTAEVERLSGHPATEAQEQMLDAAESPDKGHLVLRVSCIGAEFIPGKTCSCDPEKGQGCTDCPRK